MTLIGFDKPKILGLDQVDPKAEVAEDLHGQIMALLAGQDAEASMNALCMSMAVTLIMATDRLPDALAQADIIPSVVGAAVTGNWLTVRNAAARTQEPGQG